MTSFARRRPLNYLHTGGLRDRSATGWVNAQRENLSPVTPRARGNGGVYRRGSPTGLHPLFYLPCCFTFLFCGQEGRRLAALYRLPVTEQYYSEIPLFHFLSSLQPWNISVVPLSSPSWTSAARTTSSEYVRGTSGRLPSWPLLATTNIWLCRMG